MSRETLCASTVATSSRAPGDGPSSVARSASFGITGKSGRLSIGRNPGRSALRSPVRSADHRSSHPIPGRLPVPGNADSITVLAVEKLEARFPVRDLTVEDSHEFYANGVLVHNSWRYKRAWDMLLLGLRLGQNPQVMVTTTPRPTELVKSILGSDTTVKTGGSTYDNRPHLAPEFFDDIVTLYEGTRLGRQEIYAEVLAVLEGAWFTDFNPKIHVLPDAEFRPGRPVYAAIDSGVSRHTGAVFFQFEQLDAIRVRINVFGDYYAVDLYSEANALAVLETVKALTIGPDGMSRGPDFALLDPAATAHSGVGPAAFGEYKRVFGERRTQFWPQHLVIDGLDQLELLMGGKYREPELLIHPRCQHLIDAFNGYVRKEVNGIFLPVPKDPQHPYEDLMDALRGGVRHCLPEGRKPRSALRSMDFRRVM